MRPIWSDASCAEARAWERSLAVAEERVDVRRCRRRWSVAMKTSVRGAKDRLVAPGYEKEKATAGAAGIGDRPGEGHCEPLRTVQLVVVPDRTAANGRRVDQRVEIERLATAN